MSTSWYDPYQKLALFSTKGVKMTEKARSTSRKPHLRKGEQQRPNGTYAYRWTDNSGRRHTLYSETLEELRVKEQSIVQDQLDGIKTEARYTTLNEVFELWQQLKRGIKDNTYQNYLYLYDMYVRPLLGRRRIQELVKSDVKRFYNTLAEERGLSISTIDNVHTVLHQVLSVAVDDSYIRNNPADNTLKELKQALAATIEKRRALARNEEERFLDYLWQTPQYQHWYPVFAVMLGTGMRVGEAVGLRWCDIDLNTGMIDINHTLVYYRHKTNGCYCNIHSPKTKAGIRQIPMLDAVKKAFLLQRRWQMENSCCCDAVIDGYTDFIFVNRFGQLQHQGTLNKALRRIIRDCNNDALAYKHNKPVLLPRFSCHNLRHTFATRLCEAGVNIKVIQETLGHTDVATTLNIYAEATENLKKAEFARMEADWRSKMMQRA